MTTDDLEDVSDSWNPDTGSVIEKDPGSGRMVVAKVDGRLLEEVVHRNEKMRIDSQTMRPETMTLRYSDCSREVSLVQLNWKWSMSSRCEPPGSCEVLG